METELEKLTREVKDLALDFYFKNNLEKSYELFSVLLEADPEDMFAKYFLGVIQHKKLNYPAAIKIFEEILEKEPENIGAMNSLALVYIDSAQTDKAIEYLKNCIKKDRKSVMYLSNLGIAYSVKGWYRRAMREYEKVFKISKDSDSLVNISNCYNNLGDIENAIDYCEKALTIDPENQKARFNRAVLYGLEQKWDKCFEYMEAKWNVFKRIEKIEKPMWNGESLLNKKILVYSEQASGDMIQFARYTKHLKNMGAYVILECSKDLHGILKHLSDEIRTIEDRKYDFDYHVSVVSLPKYFGVNSMIQNYITPEKSKLNWSAYSNVYKVGIIWAGSAFHPNDFSRSINCVMFKDLCKIPNTKIFSLQKDTRKRFWRSLGEVDLSTGDSETKFVDMRPFITDFASTASIINELNLVIAVDTATAHLAGAMGKETWLLLPYVPDWRWGLKGEKTIWYDSVKVFRQSKIGDWKGVIKRVEKSINNRLSHKV